VTLAVLGDAERRALVAAGLAVEHANGTTVVGWIVIEKHALLAEVDGVERVAGVTASAATTRPSAS
jgi:hypothetical protein